LTGVDENKHRRIVRIDETGELRRQAKTIDGPPLAEFLDGE
jgi:hypothetical protein